jgi:hypothetical protein
MYDCLPPESSPDLLEKMAARVLGDLGVPVAFGLNAGHVASGGLTLPLGVEAALLVEPDGARLTLMEAAVCI